MRRMKGILALMLMLIMAIGMTITVSAADTQKSAKITVLGAEGATLYYEQVIVADPTTRTGWDIVDAYRTLFASFGNDEQSQIEGYIAASESVRAAAIKDANVSIATPFNNNPMTVTSAGLYVIKGSQEGYTYNLMLAYIGFDEQTGDNKGLVDTTIKAKKTPETVSKTMAESNKFVQIGDEIEYTVETTVPYSPYGSQTTLVINDELTGGVFKLNDNNKVEVTVSLGDQRKLEITPVNNTMTIDLSYLIVNSTNPAQDNLYANQTVTLKYTAIVTGTVVENTASINNKPGTKVTSYTGKLKITKMNEAGSNDPTALAGATFVVINGGKYAIITDGKLAGWSDKITEACYIVTADEGEDVGTATVEGFDADNKTYAFHEVIAPPGYKVNPNDVTVVWQERMADNEQIALAVMHDSTVSTLPYTGGSGTAAFTGCGVLLMSLAAGLYFSNKKNKSVK